MLRRAQARASLSCFHVKSLMGSGPRDLRRTGRSKKTAMKMLRSNSGSVAIHVSSAAVQPEKGLNLRALVDFVGGFYGFSVRPSISPSCADRLPLVFLGGRMGKALAPYASLQLAMFPDRHAVTAKTTEVAETVLYDLTDALNQQLDYRFDLEKPRLSYASSVVVDFDRLDSSLSFHKIANLLNSSFPALSSPFRLQKLTVDREGAGRSAHGRSDAAASVFCSSAPMKTSAHVQLLHRIENTLAS